jgi:hypothetical protein
MPGTGFVHRMAYDAGWDHCVGLAGLIVGHGYLVTSVCCLWRRWEGHCRRRLRCWRVGRRRIMDCDLGCFCRWRLGRQCWGTWCCSLADGIRGGGCWRGCAGFRWTRSDSSSRSESKQETKENPCDPGVDRCGVGEMSNWSVLPYPYRFVGLDGAFLPCCLWSHKGLWTTATAKPTSTLIRNVLVLFLLGDLEGAAPSNEHERSLAPVCPVDALSLEHRYALYSLEPPFQSVRTFPTLYSMQRAFQPSPAVTFGL